MVQKFPLDFGLMTTTKKPLELDTYIFVNM